jgi:hypothetical protein
MFHLDYLSCFLTILATALVGRKSWMGLLISIVNTVIVCVIGFRTSQFGFIPANVICIGIYAFSIRSWVKQIHTHRIRPAGGTTETTMVKAPYTPIVRDTETTRFRRGSGVAASKYSGRLPWIGPATIEELAHLPNDIANHLQALPGTRHFAC